MSKSKIKISTDDEILENCQVDFKIGEITAKRTGSRSVYSPRSESSGSSFSGGGGSSGGGGGGGGSSSGGGGGHGF